MARPRKAGIDSRPVLTKVMPLPAEIRQRLRISGLGPEASGDLLARDLPACVEGEIRQHLLLTDGEGARHRQSVDDDAESAEKFEPEGARAWHGAQEYTWSRDSRLVLFREARWIERGRA